MTETKKATLNVGFVADEESLERDKRFFEKPLAYRFSHCVEGKKIYELTNTRIRFPLMDIIAKHLEADCEGSRIIKMANGVVLHYDWLEIPANIDVKEVIASIESAARKISQNYELDWQRGLKAAQAMSY